eukprot:GHVU01130141.1.p1 GENE.GHVU01130141.1~~GHVU01130141.1.p1  ORF type:complete len:225 (+),score=11.75 GHVU01130141.1:818-1492(+)
MYHTYIALRGPRADLLHSFPTVLGHTASITKRCLRENACLCVFVIASVVYANTSVHVRVRDGSTGAMNDLTREGEEKNMKEEEFFVEYCCLQQQQLIKAASASRYRSCLCWPQDVLLLDARSHKKARFFSNVHQTAYMMQRTTKVGVSMLYAILLAKCAKTATATRHTAWGQWRPGTLWKLARRRSGQGGSGVGGLASPGWRIAPGWHASLGGLTRGAVSGVSR